MVRKLTYRLDGERQDRRKEVDKKVVLSVKKCLTSVRFFDIMSITKRKETETMKNNMNSNHYNRDRRYREKVVQMIGEGTIVKVMTVDRGHPKGPEVHELSNTGIITVWNYNHTKVITKLIARPGQVKRYYKDTETVPMELMMLAREHLKLHYNR